MNRSAVELLGDNIPQDEALLMKNGRYCCLICHHRPIFDTIAMLSIHRNGKKHTSAVECLESEKQALNQLATKRAQEEYVRTGKTTILGFGAIRHEKGKKSLLCAAPYDPKMRRSNMKPDRRKHILQVEDNDHDDSLTCSEKESSSKNLDTFNSVRGRLHRSDKGELPQTIAEYRKLKSNQQNTPISVQPYQSKKRTESFIGPTSNEIEESHLPSNTIETSHHPSNEIDTSYHPSNTIESSCKGTKTGLVSGKITNKTVKKEYVHKQHQSKQPRKPRSMPTFGPATKAKSLAEKYQSAFASGWKRSPGGTWRRDENVEFDSDEEPPDLP